MRNRRRCRNCGDEVWLEPFDLCPSCRRIGSRGMFLGGLIVGAIAALMKVLG